MAHEATQTIATARSAVPGSPALRAGLVAWAASRLSILAIAAVAAGVAAGDGLGAANAQSFDRPALTQPFGEAGDALLSPLARWDAAWYLDIAASGYPAGDAARPAFFPLYPLLVAAVGEIGGGSPGALLIAAYLVSLAALLAALVLLHRLTELELGRPVARSTLLLLSVFPASLFLGAPYSESLFLLCAVAAFLAARHDRFALAGLAAAAASATRSAGVLLLVPVALLYLYGPRGGRSPEAERAAVEGQSERGRARRLRPRYPLRRDLAWLALAPAGLVAYALGLGLANGDALAFASAQELWGRELGGPLAGLWEGIRAGAEGAWTLIAGAPADAPSSPIGSPTRIAALDLALLATLAGALVAAAGVLRRLPLAYGAWIVAALVLALSYPVDAQPLMSLPRFVAVLFPLFMWLALVCERRRATGAVAVGSAALLGVCVAQFAAWRFVA
jgi:hypothetical protein